MDYKIKHKYKIEDFEGIYYTATITKETETHIFFLDRDNLQNQLAKQEIKRSREVVQ